MRREVRNNVVRYSNRLKLGIILLMAAAKSSLPARGAANVVTTGLPSVSCNHFRQASAAMAPPLLCPSRRVS